MLGAEQGQVVQDVGGGEDAVEPGRGSVSPGTDHTAVAHIALLPLSPDLTNYPAGPVD
ncbi:hypothetical protein ABZ690_27260 [Streptomyces sp. NPDC006967]|uniref:hypothetical protein n=1 Tax=unclassified Streptomyces TaxID=2593676 RepID=UPI0034007A85